MAEGSESQKPVSKEGQAGEIKKTVGEKGSTPRKGSQPSKPFANLSQDKPVVIPPISEETRRIIEAKVDIPPLSDEAQRRLAGESPPPKTEKVTTSPTQAEIKSIGQEKTEPETEQTDLGVPDFNQAEDVDLSRQAEEPPTEPQRRESETDEPKTPETDLRITHHRDRKKVFHGRLQERKQKAQTRQKVAESSAKTVDEIVQERLDALVPEKTFKDDQGATWKIKAVVDQPANGETIKVFQVENPETGEEKAEWLRETDLRDAFRAQVEKEREEKKQNRIQRPTRRRKHQVKVTTGDGSKIVEEVTIKGISRPGISLRLEEAGRPAERPRPQRGGGREGPPPRGPEVGRGEGEEPPESPRISEEGAPKDPGENYVDWKLDEYKMQFSNHPITEFGSILEQAQIEKAFRLDEIADSNTRRELFYKIRAEIDFHNAFAHRVEYIDSDVVKAYELAKHLDLRDKTRIYAKGGVALAQRLFNRYGRELVDDASLSFAAQKYAKVETGNELDKYHNQENWNTIRKQVIADLMIPVDKGGPGLDQHAAEARAKLGEELFKWDGQFANLGKSLVVEEEEEKFYGGGFEYQLRREFANLPWAKREGVPAVDLLQDVLDELKERHNSFRLTNNLSGWGTFNHHYPYLRLKDDSVEKAIKGLSDDDKKDVQKVRDKIREFLKLPGTIAINRVMRRIGNENRLDEGWEIDIEKALLGKEELDKALLAEYKRGSMEDLPYEHIDWHALERGERGTISAWIADGIDATALRKGLFDTEKGVAWRLHDSGLAQARDQVTNLKMGGHFATGSGKGERYDFQGVILAKISEKECRPWIRPRDYHGYSEFAGRTVSPAVNNGLFEHDVFMVYNAAVAEIRQGTGINGTWVAQRLLAFHDTDTLRAYFGTDDSGFTTWIRRAALGDTPKNPQEQTWQQRLNSTRHQDIRAFHLNLIREPLRARVRWDERRPGYELQGEFISHIDNLIIQDEWKLMFVDPQFYQDVLDGKKTVNRALAEGLISTRNQMKIKGAEEGFEKIFLDTLTDKKIITDDEANAIAPITDTGQWNDKVNELLNKRTNEIFIGMKRENLIGRHLVDEDRLLATLSGSYNAGFSKEQIRARHALARARGQNPYNPVGNRVDIWPMVVGDPYETWERKIIHEDPTNPANQRVEHQPTTEDLKEMTLAQEPIIGSERTRQMLERLGYREFGMGPIKARFSGWDVKNFIATGGPLGDFDKGLEERIAKIPGKFWGKLMPLPKLNPVDIATVGLLAFGGLFGGIYAYEMYWILSFASRMGLSPSGAYRFLVRGKYISPGDMPFESEYKKNPQRMVDLIRAS